ERATTTLRNRCLDGRQLARPGEQRAGSFLSGQCRWRTRLGGSAVLVQDLDKGLGFRITPGQASLFQVVGALPPKFTALDGPACHHASIGQWVENRRGCSR